MNPDTNLQVFRFVAAMKKAGKKPNVWRNLAEIIALVLGDNPQMNAVKIIEVLPKEVSDALKEFGFSGGNNPKSLVLDDEDYKTAEELLETGVFVISGSNRVMEKLCLLLNDLDHLLLWRFLRGDDMDAKLYENLYSVFAPFRLTDRPNWGTQLNVLRDATQGYWPNELASNEENQTPK
ncbi:MAG TPA: hypothetical protein VG965_06615 [Patescibacteria group bacterium]|nr:hypothetical protein [Patescibacteria group bacterium]